MSKLKTVLLVTGICVATNGLQFGIQYKFRDTLKTKYTEEIAALNSSLTALGPIQDVYTVSGAVKAGDEITEDQITTMSLPSSMITETYIADPSEAIGQIYKVAINPGTPLTTDMLMSQEITDTTRDFDITVDRCTVGLTAGDYADLRITLPYGDDYVVLSHLRIESIGAQTFKVYLDERQWHTYQGALVDCYLHADQGTTIYLAKYIEPGVQKPAEEYYAVPKNIEAIMMLDPNIVDKAFIKSISNIRKPVDDIFESLVDEDVEKSIADETGKLSGGRSSYNGAVYSDFTSNQTASEDGETHGYWGDTPTEEETTEETPTEEESVFEGEEVVE